MRSGRPRPLPDNDRERRERDDLTVHNDGLDNEYGISYDSDVEDADIKAIAALVLGGAALGSVVIVWLMPRTHPRYLWTFCIFVVAALVFWIALANPLGAVISLGFAALVVTSKIMNIRERLSRKP